MRNWWYWLLPSALIVALDQVTKVAITRLLQEGESMGVTSFFNLVLAYNKGVAFSMFSREGDWQQVFFSTLAFAAVIFVLYLMRRHAAEKLFCAALSLILGGAIGNLIDRVRLGHVVDFLDFHWGQHHWPAFNVADSAISVGAVLLILDAFRRKPAPLAADRK